MIHERVVSMRVCANPSCDLAIEEDRARHAVYCKRHGAHDAAKARGIYKGGDLIVLAWRAANRDLVRTRTRLYVRRYRARKKLEQQLTQGVLTGAN
jgi:hypothetical protein